MMDVKIGATEIKDILMKAWGTEGTLAIRYDGDRLIITIGSSAGVYAMVKIPEELARSLVEKASDVLEEITTMEMDDAPVMMRRSK